MIPFNKPYLTGDESGLMEKALRKGRLAGNGYFTKKCHSFFKENFGFDHCYLTNSATAALEMVSLLCDIKKGDEVIVPSYTYVSTATPFALRGADIVFCDSEVKSPNMDVAELEKLISSKTKVIVVVHYAGLACDMQAIMELANENNIIVVEDAAHSIGSRYKDEFIGTIGHFAAFSFHETKNISSGQGGMLVINDDSMLQRAEILWVKGTNQLDMQRGNVAKYEWMDLGSNFYPSEITAAFLYAQLQEFEFIQRTRKSIWESYYNQLHSLDEAGKIKLPFVKDYQTNNFHIFYIICGSNLERSDLIEFLKANEIMAVFHYLPLHSSPYIRANSREIQNLPNATNYSDKLVRLPLFVDLTKDEIAKVSRLILSFYA